MQFDFKNGKESIVLPWKDLIALRKDYNESDIAGDSNKPIFSSLELLNTTDQGAANAIKATANLRGILKNTKGMLDDEDLAKQKDKFVKEYLAVVHGAPEEKNGRMDDLLFHDRQKNMTYVVKRKRKGVRDASLEYEVISERDGLSLVQVHLLTGRTHQIRAQFASRKMPLVGDGRYGARDKCAIALWSYRLSLTAPSNGERLEFTRVPPESAPWDVFSEEIAALK